MKGIRRSRESGQALLSNGRGDALNPINTRRGSHGRHSRQTPDELVSVGERTGLDASELIRASRLSARVDNNAVGDGFQLYLHSFIVARDGQWVVIQQGMNDQTGMARRYHWHSA